MMDIIEGATIVLFGIILAWALIKSINGED